MRTELSSEFDSFIRERQLPETFHELIDNYYLPLAVWLEKKRQPDCALVVGICGGQGSGKSTLTEFLRSVWLRMGLRSVGFSLDDLYLTKAEREQLARQIHPLLKTRGVPGTHDVQLGLKTIDALLAADAGSDIALPLFDKSTDDRAPCSEWPHHRGTVDILLLEGWCVGAKPWRNADVPINSLEKNEDPDGTWRNYINRQLAGSYRELFERLDLLLMLKVPDMESVLEWRRLQERKLRERTGGGMDDRALVRFVQHYERITRNLLAEMPARADCVFELGRDHRICGMRLNS
ncbi:phosphoribulokinase [Microbulbifer thermotolerans]|uniref:phosphoribulokinase n=1 Tax=Microbulbifer thermotolerans TaxID=252514 RepID=UPI00224A4EA2|nr:phosphoribulokinase [Microbulbifer thermotolerans]MCX2779440.1 phosphoribulokinase [Microbulbifer thermotolerans]MCX2806115.1 phosphoribulokinase [Microbulbifer thermotolerans]MCX2842623.1 phosphoribulokinase [Microbulbifer thermotolerans]